MVSDFEKAIKNQQAVFFDHDKYEQIIDFYEDNHKKEYKMKWKRTKEDEDRYRAAIAQWIRLLRPSWSPRLKSQAFTFIVYCAIFVLDLRKGRNIQKRSALTHI